MTPPGSRPPSSGSCPCVEAPAVARPVVRVPAGHHVVATGVPDRVARLRALGNAVVPQVVAEIGRAILAAEAETRRVA